MRVFYFSPVEFAVYHHSQLRANVSLVWQRLIGMKIAQLRARVRNTHFVSKRPRGGKMFPYHNQSFRRHIYAVRLLERCYSIGGFRGFIPNPRQRKKTRAGRTNRLDSKLKFLAV